MRRALLLAALLLSPAASADEPMSFVRIDQTGGVTQGDVNASYSLETSRAVVAVEGSGEADTYRGVTHRLAATYGVLDWLAVGFEQSIRQQTFDEVKLGMFSPIARVRLDALGVPLPGLGVYGQGRIRVSGRRPDSLVSGVLYERELGPAQLGAMLGYERSVGDAPTENGLRAELGASFRLAADWRLAAEVWGNLHWTPVAREMDWHGGPSLQRRVGPFRLGAQLGVGVEERLASLVVDTVALVRLGLGF